MRRFSGTRLAQHRNRRGLRPEHVGVHINRSAVTVREYEHGNITPPADVVGLLADVLEISTEDLYEVAP